MIEPTRDPEAFIRAETRLSAPPHVPEIRLHLADEAVDLWHRTEEELGEMGLPPPYWAFAWAGGQAIARYVLDHPETVRGRTVLDFASGSGIVAIAAAMAGAARVLATDIDRFSLVAIGLNAVANKVTVETTGRDILSSGPAGFDVVLAGDVFYEKPMADRVEPFLKQAQAEGALVLFGDPGRSYLPKAGIEAIAEYRVPVTRAIEDNEVKHTRVWRFL
ncbi:class I SAM-dependent methyltransferase [Chthonobacter albigriseus]|uniref:class I SAM-dependent methyltransferase n=1 Tax=Chthonobacter albigriseus TaxID=1683161 RepID=UPI0015EF0E2A|nr:methyltransferase [Chthonobacter albigriseus]